MSKRKYETRFFNIFVASVTKRIFVREKYNTKKMINILTYNDIDSQQWQSLVERSPYATWFQTPEAYQFYEAVKNEMTPFAFGIERDGELRAVVVGYVTKEKSAIKQFFTCRAIIIGGPLLAEDASDAEVAALLKAVKECKVESLKCKGTEDSVAEIPASTPYTLHPTPIYIETRNFHDYSRWKSVYEANGFAYQPHLNFHVDCTKENILASMSESRRRQI